METVKKLRDILEAQVPHGIPLSHRSYAELRHDYIEGTVHRDDKIAKGKVEKGVHPDRFRAAKDQPTVNSSGSQTNDHVRAIRDKNGLYHIVNGHHRVFNAKRTGKTVDVHYYDQK